MPPSPFLRLPIVGHLHLLLLTSALPHHALATIARRLGPIFSLQLGQVLTLVISSPGLAKEVLKTHDHVFASRPQIVAAQCLSFGCSDVTFSPHGPYWRQARKICVSELLGPRRASSFRPVREEETARLVSQLQDLSGSKVDISRMLFAHTNDILCRVAFGKRFINDDTTSGDGSQKRNLAAVLTETQALLAGFSIGDFYPCWGWVNSVTALNRRLERNLRDLRGVCNEIIEEHVRKKERRTRCFSGEQEREEEEEEDFLDVLMRVQQRGDLEVPITDDNLKALVLDMFVAGTDTTAVTLEWTLTELVKHPEVLKKAQAEICSQAYLKESGNEVDFRDFVYMKAVIRETLRLHPPVPLLVPRESMERCTLDGYEVPARTRVLINTYAIGRDADSWDDPLEFRPERFEDANRVEMKDRDFRFLPFGGGRRGCPGSSFGLATVEITLARLLYHFDWALPRGIVPDDVDMDEVFGLATRKKSALILVPTVHKGRVVQ
ncbi:hypothetical protein CDL15_Pgr009814 [Punica granatum]|nr:hypothetical protein CDL15_Pgr009814 [Punica granatum]